VSQVATEKSKTSVTEGMLIITKGLVRLIEGQKRFAEEFGLNLQRLFPEVEEVLLNNDFGKVIQEWLETAEGVRNLQQMFESLVKHQLALISALDGIALQTIRELTTKELNAKLRLGLRLNKSAIDHVHELKNNQQLRYQKLIVPGFIDAYVKTREKLQKEIINE
jgi:hypothetical protein